MIRHKLEEKGQKALDYATRAHLVQLATAELPWLHFTGDIAERHAVRELQKSWPELHFYEFDMNGADDFTKYSKISYNL